MQSQPSLRLQLTRLLANLPNMTDPRERQELVRAAGFGHLFDEIEWTGSARVFCDGLLAVIAAEGQAQLVGFLANLESSGAVQVGVEDQARLATLRAAVAALPAAQWQREFPVGETGMSLRAAVIKQNELIAEMSARLEKMGLAATSAGQPEIWDAARDLVPETEQALANAGPAADPRGYYLLGMAYAAHNEFERAEANLLAAIKADPDMGDAYLGLSVLYQLHANRMIGHRSFRQAEEDLQKAEQYVKIAWEKNMGDPAVDLQLGYVYKEVAQSYLNAGRQDDVEPYLGKATTQFRKVLGVDENNAGAHNGLGNVYLLRGDYDRAIAESEKATELSPDYLFAFFDLAIAYFRKAGAVSKKQELASALRGFHKAYQAIVRLDGTDAGALPRDARQKMDEIARSMAQRRGEIGS